MLEQFKNHIQSNLPFLQKSRLLLAVSGGVDSVVLTHLCKSMGLDFAMAHCNFNLRGDESDADEDFVLDLADDWDLEVFVEGFDCSTYAKLHKLSIQMAARELRYDWFNELCNLLHFDYVLTAHHADDNLETFLINLSRGTGLDGLTGIPEINDTIVRPLLRFSREDIEGYAKSKTLTWREDSSNAKTDYLRNKLRHEVIPNLKTVNSQFLNNFQTTQSHLKDLKTLVEDRMDAVWDQVVDSISDEGIYFNIQSIKALNNPKGYLYQLLKNYGFTEWNDMVDLLDAQSGKQLFSDTHRLIKDREALILTTIKQQDNLEFDIQENTQSIETPLGLLTCKEVKHIDDLNSNTIYVDRSLLSFPLTLRLWQDGDYFYPFGMQGRKKLSKFLKDKKQSVIEKENTWLLCSGEDVVWVVGKRQDDRFKITDTTKQIFKLSLEASI